MANPKRHSNPVDWAEALTAELVGTVIPPHALSIKSLYRQYREKGGKLSLIRFRTMLAERSDMKKALGMEFGKTAMFYWRD